MNLSDIDQKLFDFLSGALPEKEVDELREWLNADARNSMYYQQYKQKYLNFRWGLRVRMISGDFVQIRRTLQQHRRFLVFRNIAAIAVFVLIVGGGILWYHSADQEKRSLVVAADSIRPGKCQAVLVLSSGQQLKLSQAIQTVRDVDGVSIQVSPEGVLNYSSGDSVSFSENSCNRLLVPKGGEYKLQLADGTQVWLNAATEFSYPVAFTGKQRKVFLKGEAYFEVAKDSLRPFIVMADDVEVKVYGTKFNVENYASDHIRTVLVEGAVGMARGGEEVRLKPGQKGETVGGGIQVETIDVAAYVAWKDGDFVFENERLEDIMEQISRWYDVNIFYSRESSKDIRLSGDMKRYKEIQALLYYFERISDVRFEIKERTIVIK